MVEIIVEIGTQDQKELITQELSLYTGLLESQSIPINLKKVIVASDFSRTVNAFQGTTDYRSDRGIGSSQVEAMAKIVNCDNGSAIIISPLLFTEAFDSQIRFYMYFHETIHLLNKPKIPEIPLSPLTTGTYLHNAYVLYGEYYSDRRSFGLVETCFATPSERWTSHLKATTEGFASIINDAGCYDFIRKQILLFRLYRIDVDQFLKNTKPAFDTVAFALIHYYATVDQYPRLSKAEGAPGLPLMNEKTYNLLACFREKYEKNDFDLNDSLDVTLDFMTNFGIRLKDTAEGLYCDVVDI